ncbi:response regulator, partial [Sulfurovum sp. bin170]|uniref:response regulator n=1 Tax=Sulfurovum sp. bin170 TaxID=2695268 RepID=UPI0013E003E0
FSSQKPDIIITDIQMPKMDGLEFITKVRESNSNIPIIVLSAHSEKEKLFKSIKLGVVDYLTKPIDRKEFKSSIDNAIDKILSYNNNLNYEGNILYLP